MFTLNCSASLNLYVVADDLFTAYLNGIKVLTTPYNEINKANDWYKMVFSTKIHLR